MGLVASWVIFISIFVRFDLKPGSGVKFDLRMLAKKKKSRFKFVSVLKELIITKSQSSST